MRKIPEAYTCFEKAIKINPGHQKAIAARKELAAILDRLRKR
jgi:hypothetical protein